MEKRGELPRLYIAYVVDTIIRLWLETVRFEIVPATVASFTITNGSSTITLRTVLKVHHVFPCRLTTVCNTALRET